MKTKNAKKKGIKFEFYVLNYDFNNHKVINFNIFQNWVLNDRVVEAVREYVSDPVTYFHDTGEKGLYGFEALCEELRRAIMWQEWSRREYEIFVGDAFCADLDRYEKWDCYDQCLPNIPIIARECIYQFQQQSKEN